MLLVLANTLRLEHLVINEEVSEFTPDDLDPVGLARVCLPRLTKLELCGPVPFMAALCSQLLLSSSASVIIKNEMDLVGNDSTSLVPLVQTGVIPERDPLRAVHVYGSAHGNVFIIQGSRTLPYTPTIIALSSDLHMLFEDVDRHDCSATLIAYFSATNLDHLEELEVYHDLPFVPWRTVFSRMPNVHKLKIGDYANTCGIIEALMPFAQGNG